ncbi:bifunctional 4-hydroxy-3-methylbut-2-enyl diphosphate reductase/30S ribosomal protein S1 [Dehalobacter sp. DCM]|uniref:bifunctional 4-hydroxy-3-methylbut-2-enyl diphosphate reductase/30S ribosomal protein S1 n=1 Tax=Dehalobacter sp. DCM TaxID=2907827 RepID=UPI0030819489|nr:bifunctional 4-hydroxy-3-methylbut-2-enyl diphosphate reductase/30S ribosomal protein S1 [Dehalobacter sp. DCM]
MTIQRAAKAGFCFGVKRAIEMAEEAANTGNTVSLGPLIHNQQVVDYLTEKGLKVIDTVGQAHAGQQLVIRSHGVPPDIYTEAENKGIVIIDATCPFVQKAQRIAEKSSKNSFVVVIGDKSHPEVKGILGWAGSNAQAVETLDEAKKIGYYPRMTVLAQTTQQKSNFFEIVDELKKHTANLIVQNTICSATEERQASASALAKNVDLIIVVGGTNSSNTRKLGSICREITKTYVIESAGELQKIWFRDAHDVGLTAGASTPDWIIEEVYKKMSEFMEKENAAEITAEGIAENTTGELIAEESQNQASVSDHDDEFHSMEDFDKGLPKLFRGAIVKGTVVKIMGDEAFVDIAWKSEGVIPFEELSATKVNSINDVVKVGDTISVMVMRLENQEGYPVLSRKRAKEIEAREKLATLAETKEEIQAVVTEAVKGGLLVDLGMRGFVPASQIEPGFVDDLEKYVGTTLRLRVIEYDESKRKLVLSQKVILNEEREGKKEKLMETLKEGDVVKGVVRRLTNFGAFIDLGGVDGLLHVSDMAFSRVNDPSEIVKVGDEVEVQILTIDTQKNRISLGLKQLKTDPWAAMGEKYAVGSVVTAKVVRIAQFGAFVEIEDGVDGLIHISQLSDRHVNKVQDVVQVGQDVTAKIIDLNIEQKKISLSIREVLADANKAEAEAELESQPEIPEVTIGDAIIQ